MFEGALLPFICAPPRPMEPAGDATDRLATACPRSSAATPVVAKKACHEPGATAFLEGRLAFDRHPDDGVRCGVVRALLRKPEHVSRVASRLLGSCARPVRLSPALRDTPPSP